MSVSKVTVLKPQRNLVVNSSKMGIFHFILKPFISIILTIFGWFANNLHPSWLKKAANEKILNAKIYVRVKGFEPPFWGG